MSSHIRFVLTTILDCKNDIEKCRYINTLAKRISVSDIDVNDCLVNFYDVVNKRSDLFLLCLLFRFGANSNLYKMKDEIGEIHILCEYIVRCKNKNFSNQIMKDIVTIFLESDLNINLTSIKNDLTTNTFLCIKDWLIQEKVEISEANSSEMFLALDKYSRSVNYDSFEPIKFFKCWCLNILKKIEHYKHFNTLECGERVMIKTAIECGIYPLFQVLVSKGVHVTYYSINRILCYIKRALNENMKDTYFKMLLLCAKVGVFIDEYQIDFLRKIEMSRLAEIIEAYDNPRWKKLCLNKKENEDIRKIAEEFNLNFLSTEEICTRLNEIDNMTKEEYIDYLQKKVSSRGIKDLTYIKTATEYADINFAFYQNDDGEYRCYTSDKYEAMVSSGIDLNGEKLPEYFIESLRRNLEMLKELKIIRTVTFQESKEYLKINDRITNIKTDKICSDIKSILQQYGVNKEMKNTEKYFLLKEIGMEQTYFFDMPQINQDITFYRSLHSFMKRNIERIEIVIEAMEKIQK